MARHLFFTTTICIVALVSLCNILFVESALLLPTSNSPRPRHSTAMRKPLPFQDVTAALNPHISLASGTVRGTYERNGTIEKYLGIPFAKAPVGSLRWQPPQIEDKWDGIRDALVYSNTCYQSKDAWTALSPPSEDCLYLNVWRPVDATTSRTTPTASTNSSGLAALVFFYGGSWSEGSAMFPLYNGESIAALADNTIVVTVNYRLNVFGFLGGDALRGNDNSTGNFGIQDQRRALAFVHTNAKALGVDTSKIAIFGESAGSGSVANHLVQEDSFGLYTRAIMESGPPAADWVAQDLETANLRLAALLSTTGCDNGTTTPRKCLTALGASDLYAFGRHLPQGDSLVDWAPVIDGVSLRGHPRDLFTAGRFNRDVPVLLGTNKDEGALLAGIHGDASQADYESWLSKTFDRINTTSKKDLAQMVGTLYPCSKFNETRYGSSCFWAGSSAFGDYAMTCAATRSARLIRDTSNNTQDVFLYFFRRKLKAVDAVEIEQRKPFGVFHGSELALVFDFYELLFEAEERALSKQVMGYWTAFAANGSPSKSDDGESSALWPSFGVNESYLAIDTPCVVQSRKDEASTRCDFWDSIGPLRYEWASHFSTPRGKGLGSGN